MYRKERRRIYHCFISAILTLRRVAFQGSRAWAFLTYKDDTYTSISVQKSVKNPRCRTVLNVWLFCMDLVASVPGLPRSVRVLIMRRRNVCRLRIIKTRTERGEAWNPGYGLSTFQFGIIAAQRGCMIT